MRTLLAILLLVSWLPAMTKPSQLYEDEFAQRRAVFLDELRELNACAIIHSAPTTSRNGNVDHDYRQHSDLIYLTGWDDSHCILLLTPQPEGSDKAEVTLFVAPRVPKTEVWTGPKKGLTEARTLKGVDRSLAYDNFFETLSETGLGYDRWVYSHGNDRNFEQVLLRARETHRAAPPILQEASSLMKEQRLIKSDSEIKMLEQAIDITRASLIETFKVIPSLNVEYEVQAEIEYGFMKRGVQRLGFPSIVGAGKNATYLHYEDNYGALEQGSLLLLDVGAEWDYYSADISRTVPINGVFSPEQALIYQLVLDAQTAAIESIKPGVSFRKPHHTAIRTLTAGLVELGLLEGQVDTLISNKSYRKFFMHGTSHWLGLDVHDVGGYNRSDKQERKLRAGMVLTVEPGLYIVESDDVDSKWWNIGVRIEDDVLVTRGGRRVLSAEIPRTISEIEALMQP